MQTGDTGTRSTPRHLVLRALSEATSSSQQQEDGSAWTSRNHTFSWSSLALQSLSVPPKKVSSSTNVSTCPKSTTSLHFSFSLITYISGLWSAALNATPGTMELWLCITHSHYHHHKNKPANLENTFFFLTLLSSIWNRTRKNSLHRIFSFQLPIIPYGAQVRKAKFNTK